MRFWIMQMSDPHHVHLRGISLVSPAYQIGLTANIASVALTTPLVVCYDSFGSVTQAPFQLNA